MAFNFVGNESLRQSKSSYPREPRAPSPEYESRPSPLTVDTAIKRVRPSAVQNGDHHTDFRPALPLPLSLSSCRSRTTLQILLFVMHTTDGVPKFYLHASLRVFF